MTLVKKCARCGEDHEVEFKKLTRMMEVSGHTHWALCPNTGEPILMKIIPDELKDYKHRLTLETPEGDRSGCAFTVKVDESEAEGFSPFLLELERALAALYRHEHEKLTGEPVAMGHWSHQGG